MRECPRCGGRVAMRNEAIEKHRARGCDLTRAIDCPHPSHPAAQAVVEAAERLCIRVWNKETLSALGVAVTALLATLETEEENRAE